MTKKQIFVIALLVLSLIIITGCTQELDDNVEQECTLEDYGNGVLYFGCTQSNFATELSDYRKNNPDNKIISIDAVTK